MSFESSPSGKREKDAAAPSEELKHLREQAGKEIDFFISDFGTGHDQAVVDVTGRSDAKRVEKYLTDNYDLLTERQRNFLLLSLRIKKITGE